MMEKLTSDLVDGALDIINEVESMGGMTRAIDSGMAKLRIEEAATRKQARIDSGEEVVVGVNKYRLAHEEDVNLLAVDNEASRQKQVARLAQVKSRRDPAAVETALAAIRASAALVAGGDAGAISDDSNLLGLSIKAARARATVGEISGRPRALP